MDPAPVAVDSVTAEKPVFKVADHQVAGHRFEDGRVGSLVDDLGRFYKPLQDGSRGDKEVLFYDRFWADTTIPPAIQKFFPKFYGTIEINTPNANGAVNILYHRNMNNCYMNILFGELELGIESYFGAPVYELSLLFLGVLTYEPRHAIMEDLTHGFQKPGIMDVKVGARTWYAEAGPKYVEKCKAKDEETTTAALGYRLSGMQVYEAKNAEVWKASRSWCKYLKPEEVPEALKRFVSSNPSAEKGWDGVFAKDVYGTTVSELQQLKAWLQVQTTYHFFSASVLVVYEGEPTVPQAISVRLVDFAHVLYDKDAIDENFLSGLKSFTQVLTDIIDSVTKIET